MKKKKILFICTGNICRSPSAEAVFKGIAKREGMAGNFEIDSAGTTAYHVGEAADKRMKAHALERDFYLTSISRKFNPNTDFDYFDYIIGMDEYNMQDLKRMARNESDLQKISIMTDYSVDWDYAEIPDPYYGGEEGFELVLDLLEDACEGLLEKLKKD